MRSSRDFITSPQQKYHTDAPQDFVTVIILGENHGYRMKSYGPTPLIQLNSQTTILEKQINAIQSTYRNNEIIVCTGFDSDKVSNVIRKKYDHKNIRVVENQIHLNSNCCESVRLCLNNSMNSKVIIIGGGVLINPRHLEMLDLKKTEIVVQKQDSDTNFDVGAVIIEDKLGHLTYGVEGYYWTEITYLSNKKHIDFILDVVSGFDHKNKFLFEAINSLATTYPVHIRYNEDNTLMKMDNVKILRKHSKL